MSDDDFDDLELHDDEDDEQYVRIKKADLKKVRTAARAKGTAEKELATYKQRDLVREAGIEGLTERQISVLAAEAGDNPTPERLRELAVELHWAEPPQPTEQQQQVETEIAAQTQAATVANGAQPPHQRTQVPPEDIAAWPVDKQMRLDSQHPDLYDLALQGQPIDLPPGFN